jgi:transcriptional regulator with XRE-family HTH domain
MSHRHDGDSFGSVVRALRARKSMTLRELAAETGISVPHLSRIERDERLPGEASLRGLARALDVNPRLLAAAAGLCVAARAYPELLAGMAFEELLVARANLAAQAEV